MFSGLMHPNQMGIIIDGTYCHDPGSQIALERIFESGGVFWGPIPEPEKKS
jgi:hypothetical protein